MPLFPPSNEEGLSRGLEKLENGFTSKQMPGVRSGKLQGLRDGPEKTAALQNTEFKPILSILSSSGPCSWQLSK